MGGLSGVVGRVVARVEAGAPPHALLVPGDGILDGRHAAVAALVVAAKGHGGRWPSTAIAMRRTGGRGREA